MNIFKNEKEINEYYTLLIEQIKTIIDDQKPSYDKIIGCVTNEEKENYLKCETDLNRLYWYIYDAITKAWKYDMARLKHAKTAQKTAKNMTKAERMARSQKANEAKKAKAEARRTEQRPN